MAKIRPPCLTSVLSLIAILASCSGGVKGGSDHAVWEDLAPVANPARFSSEPFREHPFAVAVTDDGQTALVTLRGSELAPTNEVAVVDVPRGRVRFRMTVGARPVAVGIHPSQDFAIVLSHLSPYAAVVSLPSPAVVGKIRVGYYAQNLAFDAEGTRMFISNRASDELQEWNLTVAGSNVTAELGRTVPAGENPGAIAVTPDGSKLYVVGGIDIHVIDALSIQSLGIIGINAPIFDLAPMGPWMVALTLNDTLGLPCADDSDYPGTDDDGIFDTITDRTCSRGFADIQNEVAIINPADDTVAVRYTSDTAEVSEADREGDHPAELRKVVGALPFALAVIDANRAFVSMGASFEMVEMTLDAASPPAMEMRRVWDTGFAPRGIGASSDGATVVVANMLGETVSIIDTQNEDPEEARFDLEVGETSPRIPASDAEIGEILFFTSKFSTDGDQSCTHCHPNAENDGKAWGVATVRAYGRRATMSARNLRETQPLLIEGVFNENDFSLELEGMVFRPDFHDSSYALQVQRRDEFLVLASSDLYGESFDFDQLVRRLGIYLVREPRLLPSPFPKDTPEVDRGRQIYFQFETGCMLCHPSPSFASPENFEGITTAALYDRPSRSIDPDTSFKFLEGAKDGHFNANSLRGIWDRRGTLFHDGRARSIRETLLTPGHPCLLEGELAFNQFEGQGDTHGGVSHLSCEELDDLVAFLLTLD